MHAEGSGVRRRGRRRMPLRMKMALAGLAGVAAAWLIPRGGGTPTPTTSAMPSDRSGVTAVEYALSSIPEGVSFRSIDGVRVFLVRTGGAVQGFVGVATTGRNGPLYWCPRTGVFESSTATDGYDRDGKARYGTPLRDLDRVRVLVAAERVTVLPHSVTQGSPVPSDSQTFVYPNPCSASERVG